MIIDLPVAVDASGGDYAPQEIVKGAALASSEHGIECILLGEKDLLEELLKAEPDTGRICVMNAPQVITCEESPVQAVCGKPDSSIVQGVRLVRDGSAGAFVSAGNTGAVLAASHFNLHRFSGIERPVLAVIIPVLAPSPFLLLDAGANADCQPRYLAQFGRLGAVFARCCMGVESPRVGLLNNGSEEAKGCSLSREAYRLMKESVPGFVGNIEGQDVLKGRADVLVTDGFTGNVLLKMLEGFGDVLKGLLPFSKSASPDNGGFSGLVRKLDFSEYGGACLLGLKGNVVICHGRSKASAIKNALRLAARTAGSAMVETLQHELGAGANA